MENCTNTEKTTFEVGKWYKGWEESDKIAAKFLKKSGKYFYFSEFIRKSEAHIVYNGNWTFESQLVECSIEEIQQYLPDGHPDKIENSKKDMEKDRQLLLQEAKRRYPIGTKFRNVCNGQEEVSTVEPYFYSRNNIAVKNSKGIVYYNSKWAEIVSKPEETFILPDKWCVKVTDANKEILNSWRKRQSLHKNKEGIELLGWLISDPWYDNSYCSYSIIILRVYTEITFEQFEKYVLSKPQEGEKIEIPEYVECIEDVRQNLGFFGELGKIYKVKNWNLTPNDFLLEENEAAVCKKRFKPSTKEAYNFQFKKQEDVFKEGDYIVVLKKPNGFLTHLAPNFVFEQLCDQNVLFAKISIKGRTVTASDITYDRKDTWRYATPEEIAEYKRLNKPYDVTTLKVEGKSWGIQLTPENKDIIKSSGNFDWVMSYFNATMSVPDPIVNYDPVKVLQDLQKEYEKPGNFIDFKKKKRTKTTFNEESYKSNTFNQKLKLKTTNKTKK